MEKQYIAYYRVSTSKQGEDGLGIEAQRNTVLQYIKNNGNELIGEFTEVESGRKDRRPELDKAIEEAKKWDATIVVAKLDRLYRNVHFTTSLMESKVKFVCCDMPEADHFTIHIMAAMAEREATLISARTKEALDAKKKREPDWHHGAKKGQDNFGDEGRKKAIEVLQDKAYNHPNVKEAWDFIWPRRIGFPGQERMSYQQLADELNERGIPTVTGKQFTKSRVKELWDKMKPEDYDQT